MEKLLINTPQNVQIEYKLASVGIRLLALAIDYALMVGYCFLVIYFIDTWTGNTVDAFFTTGVFMLFLLPVFLYHFVLESFLGGQTIGKILMKIKVVRLDGSRASVYEYFIRWSLNLVDIWIMSGVIGLLAIILSKQSQRIGDMAAGTTVISLKPGIALNQTVYENLAAVYQPVYPEYQVRKLSDKDINIIKSSFQDAWAQNNMEVMAKLAEKIIEVTGAESKGQGYDTFIQTILKDHYHYHKDV